MADPNSNPYWSYADPRQLNSAPPGAALPVPDAKRPRIDMAAEAPAGNDMSKYYTSDDGRIVPRVIKDNDPIGASYDDYLRRTQMQAQAGNEPARQINGISGHPLADPRAAGIAVSDQRFAGIGVSDQRVANMGVSAQRFSGIGVSDPVLASNNRGMIVGSGGGGGGGRYELALPPDASSTLFVEGLPADCTRREVAHIFRPFVGYKEVRLVTKESKRSGVDQSSQLVEFLGDSFRKCVLSILSIGPVPAHIAFIMDGNRRYAKKHRLLDGDGHKAGYSALLNMLKYCYEFGVKFVTIYAFSIDNFKRRPDEVEKTMKLVEDKIQQLIKEETMLNFFGVRIYFLGNLTLLSESVRLAAENAMAATAGNSRVVLCVCLAYTSKDEIVHAVEESCIEKRDSVLAGENEDVAGSRINVGDVEKHMYASIAPDPDIIVGTSGETRLSNFLLWQSSNCLLYSPSAFWPEIRFRHLVWGVLEFQRNLSYLKQQKKKKKNLGGYSFLWIAFLGITRQILGFYSTGLFLWIRLVIYVLVLVKLAKRFR